MGYYRKKQQIIVEAYQWFKNGDHPKDESFSPCPETGEIPKEPREGKVIKYFKVSSLKEDILCKDCGKPLKSHGFLEDTYAQKRTISHRNSHIGLGHIEDGFVICPGSYILTNPVDGYLPFDEKGFEKIHEEVNGWF